MEEAERLNGRLVHLRPDALDETGDLLAQFLHKRRRHPQFETWGSRGPRSRGSLSQTRPEEEL